MPAPFSSAGGARRAWRSSERMCVVGEGGKRRAAELAAGVIGGHADARDRGSARARPVGRAPERHTPRGPSAVAVAGAGRPEPADLAPTGARGPGAVLDPPAQPGPGGAAGAAGEPGRDGR